MTPDADRHTNDPARMSSVERVHLRDELKAARAAVLANAEAYAEPLHALERLGRFLNPAARGLAHLRSAMNALAEQSPLSSSIPGEWPAFHRDFPSLFETVRDSRNDVMHVGARARHLTTHLVEACTILEDALQQGLDKVADFMVQGVVTAQR